MTKPALTILLLGAFALTALLPVQVYGESDSTKTDTNTPLMPAHSSGGNHGNKSGLMPSVPQLPDSLRFLDGPFDSTLLTATFVLETRHRIYPNFYQLDTVQFGQLFPLGEDEEFFAKVTRFNPHLMITTKGEYKKLSDTLYNPAARVQVLKADSVVQEGWAFHYIDAPHFRGNHYFGFKLVDFKVNEQKYVAPPKQQ